MKRNRQKTLGLWLVALFLLLSAGASAQGVVLYRKGGAPIKVPYAELDSISTYDYGEEPSVNPQINGHEYVDLGLSVKWATCNVGASSPEEYGDYYAWGETETKSTYNWSTYKWCKGSKETQTKYCTSSIYGTIDNKTEMDSEDDVAHVKWGGSWRMPTEAEIRELREQCTWTWTTQGGKNGYKVTSKKNGNSIFLPAAGFRYNSSLNSAGSYGYCWSSSLNTSYSYGAYFLGFDSDNVNRGNLNRYYGLSVRPVCP